jgi:hypothetical protein
MTNFNPASTAVDGYGQSLTQDSLGLARLEDCSNRSAEYKMVRGRWKRINRRRIAALIEFPVTFLTPHE